MTETRTQIWSTVETNAGVHFNELVRRSGYAPGQIQYHVRYLLEEERLVRDTFYGRTHYYPPSVDEWERGALALFRRETAREIVVHLLEYGSARPGDVAEALGVARSTLEHHLGHLVEQDVVTKCYDERGRVVLDLSDPAASAQLLTVVTPSIPDRLVDRFSRLVDGLLEEGIDAT